MSLPGMSHLSLCLAEAVIATVEPQWDALYQLPPRVPTAQPHAEMPRLHPSGDSCLAKIRVAEVAGRAKLKGDDSVGSDRAQTPASPQVAAP